MHGSYCRGTVTGEGSNRIITAAIFGEVFLQYMFLFCFVYSFSSFMQFTFDVCL